MTLSEADTTNGQQSQLHQQRTLLTPTLARDSSTASTTLASSTSSSSTGLTPITHSHTPLLYLLSGGVAGLSVDCVLFPLDTIKTRMQSRKGLTQSGGFSKLFSGIASAAAGSAPTAALFFGTYETCKRLLTPIFHPNRSSLLTSSSASASAPATSVNPLVHCFSASIGEVVACLIRVPTENVKQKVQAGMYRSSWECFKALLANQPIPSTSTTAAISPTASPSALSNFYRGFGSTILREIPFAFIQFPLYEWTKWRVENWRHQHHHTEPIEGWMCAGLGSISGGVAAALTTPLDVVKTRLMLHKSSGHSSPGILNTFKSVYAEGGLPRLFSGIVPRVLWISLGGGVFFGAYEGTKRQLELYL